MSATVLTLLTGHARIQCGTDVEVIEPRAPCAVTDSLLREVGLHLAVATMRRGERCRLHVAPQYAFGERGSFSFPSVPPNADVEYEVRRSVASPYVSAALR